MAQAEESHKAQLAEAQNALNESRRVLGEWVEKFRKSENYLQIRQEKEIYMSKEIANLQATRDGLNEKVGELSKKVKSAAEEAAQAKAAHEKELFDKAFEHKQTQEELEASKTKVQK